MGWIALDIGGANLKASDGDDWSRSTRFQLWREPANLPSALSELLAGSPSASHVAVTMTGELCDCYQSKTEGVWHILDSVESVAKTKTVKAYLNDGRLVSLDEARSTPLLAAASNWRALAQFAARFLPDGTGLVIDIGSTTCDVIPIVGGGVAARGLTDTVRLRESELVYTGVGRTPVCAILKDMVIGGQRYAVAAELFATSADAYLLLGQLPEDPADTATADNRPFTVDCASRRLARMICADRDELQPAEVLAIAEAVREAQVAEIDAAVRIAARRLGVRPKVVLGSGAGEFLARRAVESSLPGCEFRPLGAEIGRMASCAAPAFALAVLAREAEIRGRLSQTNQPAAGTV